MKSLSEITSRNVWRHQQRAMLRMHLFLIGQTHELLAGLADRSRAAIVRAARSDGQLDGLGLTQALSAVERDWGKTFGAWRKLFQALRRQAASIPFGTQAVLHRDVLLGGLAKLEEAEGKNRLDFLFNPQLQALIDAADQRIYQDGLRLSQRLWRLDQTSLAGIQNTLRAGVGTGASAYDIGTLLESYLGVGRGCPRWTRTRLRLTKAQIAAGDRRGLKTGAECAGQGVAYNALRLARNELQVIHAMATDALMAQMPWIEKEQINLSPAHAEQDACDQVIAAGEGGRGIYPKGAISLPIHVQCLCFKTAVLMKPEQFAKDLRGWLSGSKPWPAMDAYAARIGGDVHVDLTGLTMAKALARWASGSHKEMVRVAGT